MLFSLTFKSKLASAHNIQFVLLFVTASVCYCNFVLLCVIVILSLRLVKVESPAKKVKADPESDVSDAEEDDVVAPLPVKGSRIVSIDIRLVLKL